MKEVALNYLGVGFLVVLFLAVATALAWLLARNCPKLTSRFSRLLLFLCGCTALLVAAVGRIGWSIQTWDGGSPAEGLDQGIATVLSVFGTFALILDYCIAHFASSLLEAGHQGERGMQRGRSDDDAAESDHPAAR